MDTTDIKPPAIRSPHRSAGWVRLSSPDLAKLVALHLPSAGLSSEVLNIVRKCMSEPSMLNSMVQRIELWVDVSALTALNNSLAEQEWKQHALQYLIVRQAHYPLLRHLFNVSRADVALIRADLGAVEPPRKPRAVAVGVLDALYAAWRQASAEFDGEAERWIYMAECFPDLPLASVYAAVVIEGAPGLQMNPPRREGWPRQSDAEVLVEVKV